MMAIGLLSRRKKIKGMVAKNKKIKEHVRELIFRAKIVNFSIRLGAKNGVMP